LRMPTRSGARAERWLASRSDQRFVERHRNGARRALTHIFGAATCDSATFLTAQIGENDRIITKIAIIVAILLPNAGRIGAKCY
jgi:hypothetical protein